MGNQSEEKNLVFIVSQPRSGSTLLQSIVSNNEQVATVSEPWLLFHFLNYFNPHLIDAKYSSSLAKKATQDFIEKTSFQEGIKHEIKSCVKNIYEKTIGKDNKASYILDKTPRYYEILDSIRLVFPEAKVIVLKRNPFAVLSSVISTWVNGGLNQLYPYHRDILNAPFLLQEFIDKYKNDPHVLVTKYEDITHNPFQEGKRIYDWLNIEFKEEYLNYRSNTQYIGKYGDPIGIYKFDRPVANAGKWKGIFNHKPWKQFYEGYAHYLGKDFLDLYGYPLNENRCTRTNIFDAFKYFVEMRIPEKVSLKNDIFKYFYYTIIYRLYTK